MRVLLCDRHRLLLECIAGVFEEHGHTVEQALTPREAIELLTHRGADVCVLDLSFPKGEAGDPVAEVKHACPDVRIVVFSATSDRGVIQRARDTGAHGYVSKEDSVSQLVEVVGRVSGEWGAGTFSWDAVLAPPPRHEATTSHFLTARERQTLEGLVQGKNTSDLARWMGVRESTVSTHVQTVLSKLGVHSRLEAVAFATERRLVTIAR